MPVAELLKDSFSTTIRNRGRIYFATGQVELVESDWPQFKATVKGSRGRPYEVELDCSEAGENVLVGRCSCPYYQGGLLCKHIWAMLLTLEKQRPLDFQPASRAVVVHEDEIDTADGDLVDDEWADDDLSDGSLLSLDALRSIMGQQDTGHSARLRDRRGTSAPHWQSQLNQVLDYAAWQGESERSGPALTSKQREAWYVLNVSECYSRGQLVVDLRQRETMKNGEFGKIKKLSVNSREVPTFRDPEDRRLVEILVGNQAAEESSYGYYDYYRYQSFSRFTVAAGMYGILLPRLCSTQRFVWQLDSTLPAEEGRPIVWDDGEPWRFCLRVAEDDQQQQWRLTGDLCRGDESVSINSVVLLMATGLVLFVDRLAALDVLPGDFGWIVALRKQKEIAVPYSDRERLLEMLFRLPQLPSLALPPALQVERVQGTPRGRLEIKSPQSKSYHARNQLFAKAGFLYEDRQFDPEDHSAGIYDRDTNRVVLRDRTREAELINELSQLRIQAIGRTSHRDREGDFKFHPKRLGEIVDALTSRDWIVESDGVRIRQPGAFSLSVTSGVDWFELDGQVEFDGVFATLPGLLKALRNKEKYVRLDDGSQGVLPEEWLKKYGHLAEMADGAGDALRFSQSQALLLDALLVEQENVRVDSRFTNYRDKLKSFGGVAPAKEPRGFRGKLRDYQKEGLGWLNFLREFGLGGCLADDMGLGKTVQVLALLQSRRLRRLKKDEVRKPCLVVVPKSLVFNWIDEAERFTPKLRVLNYTGTDRKQRLDECDGVDVLVTTYGTLRRDIVSLKDMHFDYAILDESQAIKNHNSQAAKACRLLQADHRLAMTGTPVENHLGELWSLFEFLNPGMLGRSTTFGALTKHGKDDDGKLTLMAQSLRPFLLRRTKEQVLTELPEKTEQTLYCEMSPKQRKAYNELRDYYRANLSNRVKELGLDKAKIHVLEALLRLRQAACHPGLLDKKRTKELSPKTETLLEQIREVVDEGHKALVFSQFTSLLSIVREQLDNEKIVYEYLDGRTHKRAAKVKRFQSDPACPLFLISLKAGGHGLNLTAADYVFILDPWWNPAVESQAIDRAHRIGQSRRVFAYRIICRDTVEDKIVELQKTKRDLADAIVSADNSLIRSLTSEDLDLLLS